MKTSRSKIVSYYTCPRYRYLRYHYGGKGVQAISVKGPTAAGLSIHKGNALILQIGQKGRVVDQILSEYQSAFPKGIPFRDELLQEQMCLIEGVMRAFARCRYDILNVNGKIIDIERESVVDLGGGVELQFRADFVQETPQGEVIVGDFKPTPFGNYQFVRGWERNHQINTYVRAAELLYNKPVRGVQIEGYVKGKRQFDEKLFNGKVKIQNSPLCYVYENTFSGMISPYYQRASGWVKKPLWETSFTTKEYIEEVLTQEEVEALFLAPVPPIAPNPTRLNSWQTQTICNENRIEVAAKKVENVRVRSADGTTFLRVLDEEFPQNMDACYKYGEDYPCEMEQICFNGEVFEDVLASGLYEERVEHHDE